MKTNHTPHGLKLKLAHMLRLEEVVNGMSHEEVCLLVNIMSNKKCRKALRLAYGFEPESDDNNRLAFSRLRESCVPVVLYPDGMVCQPEVEDDAKSNSSTKIEFNHPSKGDQLRLRTFQ